MRRAVEKPNNTVLVFGGGSDIGKCLKKYHKNIVLVDHRGADVRELEDVYPIIVRYKPDCVVNCAGVCFPRKFDSAEIMWEREIATNLIGSFNIARACVFAKVKQIVFVSSVAGLRGKAGKAGYSASKAGVISLVQSLAEEGHKAYCVSPTRVLTKMVPTEPGEDMKKRLKPIEVARLINDCIEGLYEPGDNIIIRRVGYKTVREVSWGN